jgi:signal transduction histidine kinase/ActR/RegA family two-component response regulator
MGLKVVLLPTSNSIRRNVTAVVLATTFAALVFATAALLIYEARVFRQTGLANLKTQVELVARSTAPALAFDDRKAAATSLELLRSRRDILSAALYTVQGTLFAAYRRDAGSGPFTGPPDRIGSRVEGGEFIVTQHIVENGVTVGTLEMRAEYQLWSRLYDYLIILGSVMLFSLLVAVLIAIWLRRAVTDPIIALTDAARNVVDKRDFSLRVPKTTGGELGILVDAFNTMLAEVGQRAGELEASNAVLTRESRDRAAAEAALRVADRRKDEFLAILAHELRNPLAPLSNALAILRSAHLAPPIERMRDIMERQLRQLIRLVDDLLDVSRITTGKLVLKTAPVDLVEVVHAAVDSVRPLLDSRQHEFCIDVPAGPIPIEADHVRLVQVISNLLNNAAKYTEPGGRIELSVRVEDSWALLRLVDSGIGISDEMLREVFEMFRQGDNSVERTHSGLGVGLTLARRLVELHGGDIVASSEGPGRGSQFVVRLPLKPAASAPAHPRVEAPSADHEPQRILVVDDNIDFADTLAALLRTLGHEVRTAYSAAEGLVEAAAFAPHLAFLDIGMPGMNGYELARALRARPGTARTVLIAATGYGQEGDRDRAREAGFDHHIVKPVELRTVEAILTAFSAAAVHR